MKTKILVDFQICISVSLSICKRQVFYQNIRKKRYKRYIKGWRRSISLHNVDTKTLSKTLALKPRKISL